MAEPATDLSLDESPSLDNFLASICVHGSRLAAVQF
ncbi:Uncharacterised protein [Vibrio cholerae]|nr:Uncharacterised protein [Vibrio cholerae]